MDKIYIIEDGENIRSFKNTLEGFGYEAFEKAEEGLERIKRRKYHLLLFLTGCFRGWMGLRQSAESMNRWPAGTSHYAFNCQRNKVVGLDCGADDYMVKPFGVLELSARIRSLLRRAKKKKDTLKFEDIVINKKTREVTSEGHLCELTLKEFELLVYLMENQSRVVKRDEL